MNDSPRIAVATLFFPENCSYWTFGILHKALVSGLNRSRIELLADGGFYRPRFSVSVCTVSREDRNRTCESMRHTLEELGLRGQSTMAVSRAGDSWITIHGLGVGGINFADAFMKAEDIGAARTEIQAKGGNAEAAWASFLEEWQRRYPIEPAESQ